MLPSIPGMISAHDLKIIFSGSTDWITIHQTPESIQEDEFVNQAPFMQMSFQVIPGEPIETQIIVDSNGLVKRIKIKRKSQDLLIKPQ